LRSPLLDDALEVDVVALLVQVVAGLNNCGNRNKDGERDKERGGEFPGVESEHVFFFSVNNLTLKASLVDADKDEKEFSGNKERLEG